MTWLHMINKNMIIVMINAHTVTIVTTKPRINHMSVEQVRSEGFFTSSVEFCFDKKFDDKKRDL